MLRLLLFFAIAAASIGAALAQTRSLAPASNDTNNDFQLQKRGSLACEGAFARDTTHAKLVAAFGAKNVAFKNVEDAKRATQRATVLFDDDPTHRVVVFWHDVKDRTKPRLVTVSAPSLWIGPGGIGNGMKLTEVEKLNGKPFKLAGFDGDGGGLVRELDGKLRTHPGGCNLIVRFEPGIANPLPARYAEITGDKTILSSNRLMRRAKPQVSEWSIGYPQ